MTSKSPMVYGYYSNPFYREISNLTLPLFFIGKFFPSTIISVFFVRGATGHFYSDQNFIILILGLDLKL